MSNTKAADSEGIRLNKYLSTAGVCSRREADQLIIEGKVTINGVTATLGSRVHPGETVICDGREVADITVEKPRQVLLAVNKPRGIVCTTTDNDRAENIVDFLHYPIRVYPIGRLDKESDGLVLMTNEGELVNRILRARYFHEKEYVVSVDKPVTNDFLKKMSEGVYLTELNVTTRPCRVIRMGERSFRIVLTQGINRQIRRMCKELGYHVRALKRIRIMNIRLGELAKGEYREIKGEELKELMYLLDHPDRAEEERIGRGEKSYSGHGRYNGGKSGARDHHDGKPGNARNSGNGRNNENGRNGENGRRPAGKPFDKSHKISIARRTEGDDGRHRK